SINPEGHILLRGNIQGPDAQFTWQDSRGGVQWGRSVRFVLKDTGTYHPYVTVSTSQGCSWRIEGDVLHVAGEDESIIFTDAFSPNGDGINDEYFLTLYKTSNVIFNVFNNWGLEVFRASSGTIRWDGRDMQGKPVRPGVYSYQLTYMNTQGQQKQRSGTLTVWY
ncbi:MAG: gliding motility-associated C-terminal domain-containing protein, partial [Bacteroidota bacterium]